MGKLRPRVDLGPAPYPQSSLSARVWAWEALPLHQTVGCTGWRVDPLREADQCL